MTLLLLLPPIAVLYFSIQCYLEELKKSKEQAAREKIESDKRNKQIELIRKELDEIWERTK